MFWKKSHSKLIASPDFENNAEYSAWKKLLFESPLHTPVRNEIELPDDNDGLGWASGLKHRRWAFRHFKNFDGWINMLYDPDTPNEFGPWKIEQLSDPFLMNFGIDHGPVIGLRYKIFYNSACVGDLEISPHSDDYIVEGRERNEFGVSINIDISNAPFLPYHHIYSFLCACLERFRSGPNSSNQSQAAIEAITGALWESNRTDSMWVSLDLTYTGCVRVGND